MNKGKRYSPEFRERAVRLVEVIVLYLASAFTCGFNGALQHLNSDDGEDDVEKASDERLDCAQIRSFKCYDHRYRKRLLLTHSGHRNVNFLSPPHQFIGAGESESLSGIDFVF